MMPCSIATFEDWLAMSEEERFAELRDWNIYEGDGGHIIAAAKERFRKEFDHLPIKEIITGIYHGGQYIIGMKAPFMFDRRQIPELYLGFMTKVWSDGDVPDELKIYPKTRTYDQKEHQEKFNRYILYIRKNRKKIAKELNLKNDTEEEILDAFTGNFQRYIEELKVFEIKHDLLKRSWIDKILDKVLARLSSL